MNLQVSHETTCVTKREEGLRIKDLVEGRVIEVLTDRYNGP